MGGVREIVARLAEGAHGRTEADVQADVRAFLLAAPLDLEGSDVPAVSLEVQAGGGRRIDIEAGFAVFEVKKNLGSKSVFEAAVVQLAGYVKQRTEDRGQRFVGVLTDGRSWILLHLEPGGTLTEVDRLHVRSGGDAGRLAAWLEPVLATTEKVAPTPLEIVRRLGAGSPAAALDLADLHALYATCRDHPEVQLKRELWARLLLAALGTNFDDSDELFVTHTYLVLTAELVAHQVMDLPVDAPDGDFRALLEGQRFAMAGLHGVVEADFFDWPATTPEGRPMLAAIARRISTFDWSDVDHDVLKALYTSIIDTDTRRKLGEYYTPDWLAQKMVEEQLTDPLEQRVLDPSCGSGTFLFFAVRRFLEASETAGMSNHTAVAQVVEHVQGIDLHPVAVTLARVTYLLALTPERLADRDELTVPVFLGDSVRWEDSGPISTTKGMTVRTGDPLQLLEDELHFPEGVLEDPRRFDRLVKALADKARASKVGGKPPSIKGLLNRHKVIGEDDRVAVEAAFATLCRLHNAGRDHIWSYYIRNLARPLAFARKNGQADVLMGNPPWLAYRAMPDALQRTYRELATERGLWAGGTVATHQDLSDLFAVRSIEQYLRTGGCFSFVMPYAALSRGQFEGFRSGEWSTEVASNAAAFDPPHEFARVKPPLFQVPACVVRGTKADQPTAIPASRTSWTGRVPNHQITWASASGLLSSEAAAPDESSQTIESIESPYRSRFRQGAALVPRMLLTVERVSGSKLGQTSGRTEVRSARSSNEKKPWKGLPGLAGAIEKPFLRPMHMGSTIVAYRARPAALAVIPYQDGTLMDGESDLLDEFDGLAKWWRSAEAVWEQNKSESTRLTLAEQIDYQSKLRKQFPTPQHRVVYTASGQHLAACRVEDPDAVVEKALYWAPVGSVAEGQYLCAVLNSQTLAEVVRPLQARGQHNPRHFDTRVFAPPFPLFDSREPAHLRLAALGERAERLAAEVLLEPTWQFQKARRVIREALQDEGVAKDIDRAVRELLTAALGQELKREQGPGTPDLLGALEDLERQGKSKDRATASPAGQSRRAKPSAATRP